MDPKLVLEIPLNFDVEIYINHFSRKDRRHGVTDAIHYILDYINKDGIKNLNTENGTPLNIEFLRKNVGKRSADEAMSILLENKIIEKTKDYSQIFKTSRQYKLSNEFQYGNTKKTPILGKQMVNAIEKNFQEQIKKTEAIDEKIGHLTKFFKDGLLDFDVKKSKKIIYEMQIRVGQQIPNIKTTYNHKRKIEYLEKCKIAHLYKSLNFLGNISKISESEKFNYSITSSNQRLYSVFTNISKYIRPYFTYNGFPLTQLDLSSSQPLLLFHFLNELKWKKEQNFKSFLKEDKEYLLIQLYETKQPLMLDTLNGINDKKFNDELERFKKLFEGDFYINIIEEVKKCNPYSKKLKGFTNRKNCKKTIMYLLFERFTESKSKVPQYNSFKKTFPLITIVLDTLKEKQKNKVALILQNLESDLFLNNITKKISELNPDLPMFTIHDAILTTPEHVEYVNEIMTQIIINTTGVIPKISILKGNADLTEDKLNEITESYIEDIKNKVKNKKYVNEIENISTVKLGAFIKKYKFTSLFETIILDLNLDPTNLLSTINFIDSNSVFPPLKKVLNSEEANKIPDFRLNTGKIIEFK